ncbi:unnamed protein product, partial [Medioppia subpectinata]
MSTIINTFNICNKIPDQLKRDIKLVHVFHDIKGHNILFITGEDQVYGLGINYWGSLGLGHNVPIESPELIHELCHQNIQEFVIGVTFVLALNNNNQVYGWGCNDCGQLAREATPPSVYLKPERIAFFTNNKFITQLSCSHSHSLALASDGDVYSWGNNRRGQVGCGEPTGDPEWDLISTPVRVKFTNNFKIKMKAVYCSAIHSSFALTLDGYVFSWGNNSCHHLGHDLQDNVAKPQIITNIFNIQTVCPFGNRTYFLTNEGLVKPMPKSVSPPKPATRRVKPIKAVHFVDTKATVIESKSPVIENKSPIIENVTNDSYYQNTFEEVSSVGSGAFGTVYKVQHRYNQRLYAIKQIVLNHSNTELNDQLLNSTINELKLRSEYVIQYTTSWLEDNQRLYIQMEYCSLSLSDVLAVKGPVFGRQSSSKPMSTAEYYLSCGIFADILECVQYLHSVWPHVIHRGLKPSNIFIAQSGVKKGRYLKLSDFGLANVFSAGTYIPPYTAQTVSDVQYTAPELVGPDGAVNQRMANTKSDVYSVGVIAQQVFDININEELSYMKLFSMFAGTVTPDSVGLHNPAHIRKLIH